MDGTQSGFYYEASSNASTTAWAFHLQGGGECVDRASCEGHLHDALGSSKYWAASLPSLGFALSNDCATNPGFCDFHHVFLPYCSQDLHSGTRTTPSPETFGLYFAGHAIFAAVLDELLANTSLPAARSAFLSGDSAGGIGSWLNVDYLASRLPQAEVVGFPIAGFYGMGSSPTRAAHCL